jgi:hypothetical protein
MPCLTRWRSHCIADESQTMMASTAVSANHECYPEQLARCSHHQVTRKTAKVCWTWWGVCRVCYSVIVQLSSYSCLYSRSAPIICEQPTYADWTAFIQLVISLTFHHFLFYNVNWKRETAIIPAFPWTNWGKSQNISQDSQCAGQDLNLEPPVYESEVLPTWLQHSIKKQHISNTKTFCVSSFI